MKKKMLALMLMLLAALSALTAAAEGSLPDVGEIISGFKVTQLYALDALGGTVVHMEHEKTGAQLIYLANEDVNRTFSIGFRTKYDNDKGVPHVFEHACLSGSEKYPDPSLFFAMMNQTYNTFMNAMTATDYTIYPESSLSEDQLYVYADYVLSGVLHPLVVSDERSMMREAYRYELTDRDAQITLSGTVYSEMLGALSMNQRHLYELYKLMYPGSYTSTNTGGDRGKLSECDRDGRQHSFLSGCDDDAGGFAGVPQHVLSAVQRADCADGRTRSGAVSGADRRGLSERLRRADG